MKHVKSKKVCPICGKTFTASRERKKYCCDECATAGRRIIQKRYYKKNFNNKEFRAKKVANTRRWQLNNRDTWNEYQAAYNKRKN